MRIVYDREHGYSLFSDLREIGKPSNEQKRSLFDLNFFRYLTSDREYGKLLKSVSQCSYEK